MTGERAVEYRKNNGIVFEIEVSFSSFVFLMLDAVLMGVMHVPIQAVANAFGQVPSWPPRQPKLGVA
jgi:hypothetical protein